MWDSIKKFFTGKEPPANPVAGETWCDLDENPFARWRVKIVAVKECWVQFRWPTGGLATLPLGAFKRLYRKEED